MKKAFILSLLITLIPTLLFAQETNSVPAKASPFTAVEWDQNIPEVKFQEEWYVFEGIDGISRDSLLHFCQYSYGDKWKKRFTEDLVEVLESMEHYPQRMVSLQLTKNGQTKTYRGELTFENRQKAHRYAQLLAEKSEENQVKTFLSKDQIAEDLLVLKSFMEKNSSYNNLNGYNALNELDSYSRNIPDSVNRTDFGIFLTETIGEIGDRHSNVRNYEISGTKYFPFAFAPLDGRILTLTKDKSKAEYQLAFEEFPYLKSIAKEPLTAILPRIVPEEIMAPREAYLTRAAQELRNIESVYHLLSREIPDKIEITLTNLDENQDTTLMVPLVSIVDAIPNWYEQLAINYASLRPDDLSDPEVIETLFSIENGIAHISIPEMWSRNDAPLFFEYLQSFMKEIRNESRALIIDVRSNGGGTRDLIWELAGYFTHPDSIHVVNVAQQRGPIPLSNDLKEDLHSRYLNVYNELNSREQKAIDKFNKTFQPMYNLDPKKYSEYHYAIFNGQKVSEGKYHYQKPIYILANERSFSAASVLVTCFKGLPNITIAGVTTDGSSGNSERFYLPNSELRGRISTMVSFQKDGKTLDRFGTEPDIMIKRDLAQILWQRDSQLEKLKEIILKKE